MCYIDKPHKMTFKKLVIDMNGELLLPRPRARSWRRSVGASSLPATGGRASAGRDGGESGGRRVSRLQRHASRENTRGRGRTRGREGRVASPLRRVMHFFFLRDRSICRWAPLPDASRQNPSITPFSFSWCDVITLTSSPLSTSARPLGLARKSSTSSVLPARARRGVQGARASDERRRRRDERA